MKKSTMVTLGAALILSGMLVSVVNLNSKVAAQEPKIDTEKFKSITSWSNKLPRDSERWTLTHHNSAEELDNIFMPPANYAKRFIS